MWLQMLEGYPSRFHGLCFMLVFLISVDLPNIREVRLGGVFRNRCPFAIVPCGRWAILDKTLVWFLGKGSGSERRSLWFWDHQCMSCM